jgi:hypothetical protein
VAVYAAIRLWCGLAKFQILKDAMFQIPVLQEEIPLKYLACARRAVKTVYDKRSQHTSSTGTLLSPVNAVEYAYTALKKIAR